MTRAELLARIDSRELSGWMALFLAQHDEQEEAAERAKHLADSGDGEVIEYNKPRDQDDDDEVGGTDDGSAG